MRECANETTKIQRSTRNDVHILRIRDFHNLHSLTRIGCSGTHKRIMANKSAYGKYYRVATKPNISH